MFFFIIIFFWGGGGRELKSGHNYYAKGIGERGRGSGSRRDRKDVCVSVCWEGVLVISPPVCHIGINETRRAGGPLF